MKLPFRRALAIVGLALVAASAGAQRAYPDRPVRVVVPWPAGGSVDIAMRVVAEEMAAGLGQPVLVDNRPGAAGNIGAALAAKAAPDGYTLLVATTPMIINRSLSSEPVVDIASFTPVGQLVSTHYVLAVHPSVAASVQELVARAKANPGKLNYASSGSGTQLHLLGETFNKQAGTVIVHAPYKGGPPALADMVGGHVQMMFPGLPVVEPLLKAGQLKALAVASKQRLPQLPDVPTLGEAGIPGMDSAEWYGVVAPLGTPPEIVVRLNQELVKALRLPAVQQRLVSRGFQPASGNAREFADLIRADEQKWPLIVKQAGLKAN